jgi:hypothetical protein
MSAGDSRPLPRNWEKTWVNRSESVSNTLPGYRARQTLSRKEQAEYVPDE